MHMHSLFLPSLISILIGNPSVELTLRVTCYHSLPLHEDRLPSHIKVNHDGDLDGKELGEHQYPMRHLHTGEKITHILSHTYLEWDWRDDEKNVAMTHSGLDEMNHRQGYALYQPSTLAALRTLFYYGYGDKTSLSQAIRVENGKCRMDMWECNTESGPHAYPACAVTG